MVNPGALLGAARARRPFLDHVIRAYQRYSADGGDRLAAAVTFYWFLSLFPLLLLAVAAFGLVLGGHAEQSVSDALAGYLPHTLVVTLGATLAGVKGKAGVIGLAGLLLSGLGWVDALRDAIRTIWHQNLKAGNIVTQKLRDIAVLVGLFATITASVVLTSVTTAATGGVLDVLGFSHSAVAGLFTQLVTYLLGGLADTVLFVYLFTRLPRLHCPVRRVLKGSVLGAVGFSILNFVGGYYVKHTTSSSQATYGTFAVVVGVLLFLNLLCRFILVTAAFVVTAPYDSDVSPSGTVSREQARAAGMPPELASAGPREAPAVVDDGAPTRLGPAVRGVRAPQDEPVGNRG